MNYKIQESPEYAIEDIQNNIQEISDKLDNIENSTSETAYNTDKVRFAHGHRTESEDFEDKYDIDMGNRFF